jgi:hypothetical protein
MTTTRTRTVLAAILCAAGMTAAPVTATAAAKWKGPNIAGKYTGLTEYFGKVSFKLTRSGKILNFTLTNATLYCQVVVPPATPPGPEYEKVVTITHGPIKMQKKSSKNPQGKKFELTDATGYYKGGIVELTSGPGGGRVLDEMGFNGETYFETTSGPETTPGTELCGTKLIDWEAKPPGSKGFVAVGNSGHLRPPLSEFSFSSASS